jgi:endonuclease-3
MSQILEALWDYYGKEEPDGDDDLLGVLVRTILSQSTTRQNADRAFASLLDTFEGDFEQVERAPVERVADAIVMGGLANQKAPRIQAAIRSAREDSPEAAYSLEWLRYYSVPEAIAYLESMPGVGPKTARFVLMYAAGFDLFPMDVHIFRILERLELLEPGSNDRKSHIDASKLIPAGEGYAAHMVLVAHGRKLCKARAPRCDECPLIDRCPTGRAEGLGRMARKR